MTAACEGRRACSSARLLLVLVVLVVRLLCVASLPTDADPVASDARFTGITLNPSFEEVGVEGRVKEWGTSGDGFVQSTHAREGSYSIEISATSNGHATTAFQFLHVGDEHLFARDNGLSIVVWSCAEGVDGFRDEGYSASADVYYAEREDVLKGISANFSTGTHDWERRVLLIPGLPNGAIEGIRLTLRFSGHKGRVWFDDIHITGLFAGLLHNPSFEDTFGPRAVLWEPFGDGYRVLSVADVPGRVLMVWEREFDMDAGAYQDIFPSGPARDMGFRIVAKYYATQVKAQDARNAEDLKHIQRGFSLYADVFYQDGDVDYGISTNLRVEEDEPPTWKEAVLELPARKPGIDSVRFYLLFRRHKGKVLFDDLRAEPLSNTTGVVWESMAEGETESDHLPLDNPNIAIEEWKENKIILALNNADGWLKVPGLGGGYGETVPVVGVGAFPGTRFHDSDWVTLSSVPENIADAVFVQWVIEKVPHYRIRELYLTLRRILKPGGILSVMTHDFGTVFRDVFTTFDPTKWGLAVGAAYGPTEWMYDAFPRENRRGNPSTLQHKNVFWFEKLEKELGMAGFHRIAQLSGRPWSWVFDFPFPPNGAGEHTLPLVVTARNGKTEDPEQPPNPVIPNVVHVLFGLGPTSNTFGGRPFGILQYVSVRSIVEQLKPQAIHLHYIHEPSGYWFTKAKEYLTLNPLNLTEEDLTLNNHTLDTMISRSDYLRLKILYEHGGIYLDLDVIVMKPFHSLMEDGSRVVLGQIGADCEHGIGNSVILAPQQAPFIRRWLDLYEKEYNPKEYRAAVKLAHLKPAHLCFEYPEEVRMLNFKAFYHNTNDYADLDYMFNTWWAPHQTLESITEHAYAMHLWEESSHEKYTKRLTKESIKRGGSLFARVAKPYLEDHV